MKKIKFKVNLYSYRRALYDNRFTRPGFIHNGVLYVLTSSKPKRDPFIKILPSQIEGEHVDAKVCYLMRAYNQAAKKFNNKKSGTLELSSNIFSQLNNSFKMKNIIQFFVMLFGKLMFSPDADYSTADEQLFEAAGFSEEGTPKKTTFTTTIIPVIAKLKGKESLETSGLSETELSMFADVEDGPGLFTTAAKYFINSLVSEIAAFIPGFAQWLSSANPSNGDYQKMAVPAYNLMIEGTDAVKEDSALEIFTLTGLEMPEGYAIKEGVANWTPTAEEVAKAAEALDENRENHGVAAEEVAKIAETEGEKAPEDAPAEVTEVEEPAAVDVLKEESLPATTGTPQLPDSVRGMQTVVLKSMKNSSASISRNSHIISLLTEENDKLAKELDEAAEALENSLQIPATVAAEDADVVG